MTSKNRQVILLCHQFPPSENPAESRLVKTWFPGLRGSEILELREKINPLAEGTLLEISNLVPMAKLLVLNR